jgi:hypothetical protein
MNEIKQAWASVKSDQEKIASLATPLEAAPEAPSQETPEKQPKEVENTPEAHRASRDEIQPKAEPQEAMGFAKMREERKRDRAEKEQLARERDLAFARIREMELRSVQAPVAPQYAEDSLPDDGIPDNKIVKLMAKQIRDQGERLEAYEKRSVQMTTEMKLRTEMNDFASVVNEENLERLQEQEPELFEALDNSRDKYTAQRAAYKAIKKLILPPEQAPKAEVFDIDKKRLQENQAKPRSTSSLSPIVPNKSPLELAAQYGDVMSQEEKTKWQEQMYAARRRTGL